MIPSQDQQTAWTSPNSITEWWSTPSQSNFHRPWSAELVASLRSPFVEFWPGSVQGLKLRETFKKHYEEGTASLSIGATDVISSHLMADAGYDSIYVSGATCSVMDNATQDFGADMADYPHETVPNKVRQLFRSQLMQTKVQTTRLARGESPSSSTNGSLVTDYMVPLVADADTGHGGQTANMKLAKLFVESGAAGIHLDDQVPGTKKFGAKTAGRVLVPVEEHIGRLLAVKLQFDIMGSEALIIHRTDAETAGYLTSAVSPHDRPYILGSTNPSLRHMVPSITASNSFTKAEANLAEDKWIASANLKTLDEAVQASTSSDEYESYLEATKGLNISEALGVARGKLGIKVDWDAEACRSREGWYRYRGSIKPAIERAILCAKYTDILWTRTPATVEADLEEFAVEVKRAVPGCWLGYNLAGDVKGDDEYIRNFHKKLAKMGYVWQILPLAGQSGTAVGVNRPIKAIKEDGVLGYLETVVRPGKAEGVSVVDYAWQGGAVADVTVAAVTLW